MSGALPRHRAGDEALRPLLEDDLARHRLVELTHRPIQQPQRFGSRRIVAGVIG